MLSCFLLILSASTAIEFTGDAFLDFQNSQDDPLTGRPNNFGVFYVADTLPPQSVYDGSQVEVFADVGVPPQLADSTTGLLPISGWDIARVWFQYNDVFDRLNIGVDCFTICGDADGDGDPGAASPVLTSIGGQDLPNLARAEGFALLIDFDLNVADVLPSFVPDINVPFDFVIGVPAGQPAGASANPDPNDPNELGTLECSRGQSQNDLLNMVNCFGVYEYQETTSVNIAQRFLRRATLNGQPWPVLNHNPTVSAARPDLEWSIDSVTELRAQKGASFLNSRKEPWTLLMQGFAGSFADDGIGEDLLPSQTNYVEVNFPCLEFDVCDVCLGPGDSCLDCAGVPNGPNVYDECDVCGGNSDTCLDCNRVPNGPSVYDVCDICDGDSDTCLDCLLIPNGPNDYDVCEVCGGFGNTCLDCAGIPNGPAVYDVCDICNGDGSRCWHPCDVATVEVDACDVCDGDGSTCLDCAGVPNGPNVYDACDICGGDSATCLDCRNIPNGPNEYDVCDVCGGFGNTCLDCAGIPNGPGVYDVCDICNGDGLSCLDCLGIPSGTNVYDECDVCGGNSDTCLDCAGILNGPNESDVCGVCGVFADDIDSDKCDAHCAYSQKQAVSYESDSFLCAELTLTSYKKRSGIRAEAVCNICSAKDEFCCHGTCCPHGTHCCYNEYYGGARCCPSDQPRCTVNGCAANSRKPCRGTGTGTLVTHTCRQDEECCSFTNYLLPSGIGVETYCCHETEQCVLPISNGYGGPVCPRPEQKCGCVVRKPTPSSPIDPPSIAPSIALTLPLPFSELSALFDQVEKRTKRGHVTNCDNSPASSFDEMTHNRTRIAIKSMDALETDVGKLKRIAKGIESVIKGREESSIEVKNANQKLELAQSMIVFYERVMIHRKEYKCI